MPCAGGQRCWPPRGPRPPPTARRSGRNGPSCASSASAAWIERAGHSQPRSWSGTSPRTRAGWAAASPSRSRSPWPSTTCRRWTWRSRSPRATWTSASRRSCSTIPAGVPEPWSTRRGWRTPPWSASTPTGRPVGSSWRFSVTGPGRGSARCWSPRRSSTPWTRRRPRSRRGPRCCAWTCRPAGSWRSTWNGSAAGWTRGAPSRRRAGACTPGTPRASPSPAGPSGRSRCCAARSTKPRRAVAATSGW